MPTESDLECVPSESHDLGRHVNVRVELVAEAACVPTESHDLNSTVTSRFEPPAEVATESSLEAAEPSPAPSSGAAGNFPTLVSH